MSIKISIVSYINSYPFLYGLKAFNKDSDFELNICPPSQCAQTVFDKSADIALIPVAALSSIGDDYKVNTSYCIGAEKSVSSVILISNTPLKDLTKIYTDTHSLTSAKLLKILTKNYWNIEPDFIETEIHSDLKIKNKEAIMAIGDKCFDLKNQYTYIIDLFDAWHAFTKLPLVFAVWVVKRNLNSAIEKVFNDALDYGISNKMASLEAFLSEAKMKDLNFYLDYIEQNINYIFDKKKQKAVSIYLNYVKNID